LNFNIRFFYYGSGANGSFRERMFLGSEIPQLHKLTKIRIQEPFQFPYTFGFLQEILSMAPNLTSLYVKPIAQLTTIDRALKSLQNKISDSFTCLGLSGAHLLGGIFTGFRLTTLEINNLYGPRKYNFVNRLLFTHHSTLVTVTLGKRVKNPNRPTLPVDHDINIANLLTSDLVFPSVMETLKVLEVNLNQFKFLRVRSYRIQFPVLERLTLSIRGTHEGCQHDVETLMALMLALSTSDGPCLTLKELNVICGLGTMGKELISRYARETFPTADHHIGNGLPLLL